MDASYDSKKKKNRKEKKLHGIYSKILFAVLNKSYKQHPTKQQLYWNMPAISQTI